MSSLIHRVTVARVENPQAGDRGRLYAIQATLDGRPVGLVNTVRLSGVYPSGTPIGTLYAQFAHDDQKYVVVPALNVFAPEYEINHPRLFLLSRPSIEHPRVAPSRLVFYRGRVPALANAAVRQARNFVRPPARSFARTRAQLPARQREMLEFVRANRRQFPALNAIKGGAKGGGAKPGLYDRLGLFFMHPMTRILGGIVIVAIVYMVFQRQFHTLFGALTHFGGRR